MDNYRYGYQGYEKDNEFKGVGNSLTTEFRQFDSRVGRWLTNDPFYQFEGSQYSAFANNPIINTDPNGGWIPIVVEKTDQKVKGDKVEYKKVAFLAAQFEEGDDAKSLSKFLDIDIKDAEALFNGGCDFVGSKENYIRIPIEIAGGINAALQDALIDRSGEFDSFLYTNYNCWASAIYTSQGRNPLENNRITNELYDSAEKFDQRLKQVDYENVSTQYNKWIFGKTIFKLAEKDVFGNIETTHGCIFLGADKSGNKYVFTKNGWKNSPHIEKLSEVVSDYGWMYSGQKAYNYIGE